MGIAAGPVAAGASAATVNLSADILSFSRSKGLYGGISMDGSVVAVRDSRQQDPEPVIRQAKAGMMGSFGTSGMKPPVSAGLSEKGPMRSPQPFFGEPTRIEIDKHLTTETTA